MTRHRGIENFTGSLWLRHYLVHPKFPGGMLFSSEALGSGVARQKSGCINVD